MKKAFIYILCILLTSACISYSAEDDWLLYESLSDQDRTMENLSQQIHDYKYQKDKNKAILEKEKQIKENTYQMDDFLNRLSASVFIVGNRNKYNKIENIHYYNETEDEILDSCFLFHNQLEKKYGTKIFTKNYKEILKNPLRKILVLLCIKNMQNDLYVFTEKQLKLIIAELEKGELKENPFIEYYIHALSKEVCPGDTFRAEIFGGRRMLIPAQAMKSIIIDGKPVEIDKYGIGHYRVKAEAQHFDKNGFAKKQFNGKMTFEYDGRDTCFHLKGEYLVRKNK